MKRVAGPSVAGLLIEATCIGATQVRLDRSSGRYYVSIRTGKARVHANSSDMQSAIRMAIDAATRPTQEGKP